MHHPKHPLVVILCSAVLLLSGCALTRTETKIPYSPAIGGDHLAATPAKKLAVAEVKDSRGVDDPTTIFQKKNLYGDTMSGTYAADRPLTTILREGIMSGLQEKGFLDGSGDQKLTLSASIEDYSYDTIMGMWKSTLKPKMIVRFELKDEAGTIVWQDSIVGRSSINNGDYVVKSVTTTIDDVVTKLVSSPAFAKAVQ